VPRALVLVHEDDPARGRRIPGSVTPALTDLGFDVDVVNFVVEDPVPAGAEVVVVLGSAASADDEDLGWLNRELGYLHAAIENRTPVLGICFGGQLLARALGGTVGRAPQPERGFVDLDSARPEVQPVGRWMEFHYDAFTLPPGAEPVSANAVGLQSFVHGPHLGVQFHPEITPDAFAAWTEAWSPRARQSIGRAVDLDALTAEIAERAEPNAAACRDLIARFVARARS
jgi:GMP synthase-like glutamine amidotransferase